VQTGEIVGKVLQRWGWDPARVRQVAPVAVARYAAGRRGAGADPFL